MKTKKIILSSAVIAALMLPASIYAGGELETPTDSNLSSEIVSTDTSIDSEPEEATEEESSLEVSGYVKTEVAVYTKDGQAINNPNSHKRGDLHKGEGILKLFINSELGENSSFHSELQLATDTEGIDGYKHHRNYTQYDYLREFYVDSAFAGWDFRIGKQQVVWGKADGVKFLDIINPTDFREWGQNTMEDSRIPLWMMVAEKDLGHNDSLQLIWVPDVGRVNQIPGLYDVETGDSGQPFVSLGASSITGQYNGFFQIGKEFGKAFDSHPTKTF